jgi:cytoskeletal protein CcmA (bactofilin family)
MWKRDTSTKPANAPVKPVSEPLPRPASPLPDPVETWPRGEIGADLGRSVMIKGELSASEDLTLSGQVEGRVSLPNHTLTIGPEANIRAEIKAATVVIMGAVSGNVTASQKVDVRATGSVVGDVVSARIVIADGGQLLGKVHMTGERAAAEQASGAA